ncbi:MAG: hypothetical protein DWQ07_17000 [Chloroflexi bacterium]|nr:MAG: hypothetical protein DWQ07_17000 [Chloroflexota bacterium]MBL1195103.1 hypothetical protein [Chloroflexota bacterium]
MMLMELLQNLFLVLFLPAVMLLVHPRVWSAIVWIIAAVQKRRVQWKPPREDGQAPLITLNVK